MEANSTYVTIRKTTGKSRLMKVVYNLTYNSHMYKLSFYRDGDDYGWFVSSINLK